MVVSGRPIIILGPTAGGKSELAVALAEQLNGEVIGADSMQVYRHMNAGTAKPPPELRKRITHHLVDIVEPTQRFTVHDWLHLAQPLIETLQARGQVPIIVGGTNLYLKALLHGLFEGPGQDDTFRQSLQSIDSASLHEQLQQVDPQAAQRIDPNDRKRLTRALEVFHLTGKPISQLQTQWNETPNDRPGDQNFCLIALRWPTPLINRRINLRVKQMFYPADFDLKVESLPDEAHRLEAEHLLGEQAREALGYKQVLTIADLDEACERTKILTRRFAKQQRTWLKRFEDVTWIDVEDLTADKIVERALGVL